MFTRPAYRADIASKNLGELLSVINSHLLDNPFLGSLRAGLTVCRNEDAQRPCRFVCKPPVSWNMQPFMKQTPFGIEDIGFALYKERVVF